MEKLLSDKARKYYWFGSGEGSPLPVGERIKLGLQRLESQCSAQFGFTTSISVNPDMSDSRFMIPNVLDGSLVLEILQSAKLPVSQETKNSIKRLVLSNMLSSGAWSYFQGEPIIPEDCDTTSCCLQALIALNYDKSKCLEIGQSMFERLDIHDNGLPDIALKVERSLNDWQVKPRFDLTVMSNLLFTFCKLGLPHEQNTEKVYQLIDQVLLEETIGKQDLFTKFSKNYKDFDIFLYFVSRLVSVSQFAREYFQPKLKTIVQKRLLTSSKASANSIACKILAACYCGLFEDQESQLLLVKQVEELVEFQNTQTCGFQQAAFCVVHDAIYVGSEAVTTALSVAALENVRKIVQNLDNLLG